MAFRYSGTGWRVALSLRTFGDQIMEARGTRTSYSKDGTIGDTAHAARVSDHNPDAQGIVRALDFYEHAPGFVDQVAEAIRARRDPRVKYFIHDDRMFSSYSTSSRKAWEWGPYTGINGHEDHGHLSVVSTAEADQTYPWPMPGAPTNPPEEEYMSTQALRLIVAEAGNKGWLPTAKDVNYWLALAENPGDPQWKNDFEPAWSKWKLEEGKKIATSAGSAGMTAAQVVALIESAKLDVP